MQITRQHRQMPSSIFLISSFRVTVEAAIGNLADDRIFFQIQHVHSQLPDQFRRVVNYIQGTVSDEDTGEQYSANYIPLQYNW